MGSFGFILGSFGFILGSIVFFRSWVILGSFGFILGSFGVNLGSIWNQFGAHFGIHLEPVWGPFWIQFGVHVEIWQGFELQTPSGPDFWPLGPILAPLLCPMLAPCWPHVGPMLAVVGRLGPSWRVLGAEPCAPKIVDAGYSGIGEGVPHP